MSTSLELYEPVVGERVIRQLRQLSEGLRGLKILHVNSTRSGGGVAEILDRFIPLQKELGMDVRWEVVEGEEDFYKCTKAFHNSLQGSPVEIPEAHIRAYEEANARTAERLGPVLEEADFVFIHDPQPAPLLNLCSQRKGKWIWRCHIDVSRPYRPTWKYLRKFVEAYDASIFSLPDFAQALPHPQYIIPPSIDPLSTKNMELDEDEVQAVYGRFGLDEKRPLILQVSRFDRFKDPIGVIRAYRLAKNFVPLQLVLAGGGAADDPEGTAVLQEVRTAAKDDPDIHILDLPPDAHRIINALQRAADLVLQKSIKEGFGLVVTEAMWKGKPVIGGDVGGIRLQVINHHTGFLVGTPEGAALRIRYLLHHRDRLEEMGRKAKDLVRESFLLTRHLREYLTLMVALTHGSDERIELG
ncbi:MAG: glycosyltransferase [Candidatus Eisenbacteria sp.]|nr:glycosyltransferase [Candidatus Eisenbacteria bacterium]